MASIIQDLQIEATDPKNSVSDLLRKAKIVAVKLDLKEFAEWIEKELNGYSETTMKGLPEYRIVSGEPKAWNPYRGWQPILFGDTKAGDIMARRGVSQPIGELDDLVKTKSETTFVIDYAAAAKKSIMEAIGRDTDIKFMVGKSAIVGILDGVRNSILDWALKLEKAGVVGEGISFSQKDMQKAKTANVTYTIGHIQNFAGALGNVSDTAVVNVHQINADTKKELKNLVTQIDKYSSDINLTKEQRKEVGEVNRIITEEVSKKEPEVSKLKSALSSLKVIFEGVAGNVIAQGILAEVTKYLHHIN